MTPPRTVMLVDDSEPDNVFHDIVLRAAGFNGQLVVFDDPLPALQALTSASIKPDLVLLDINMPGVDGFGFASRLCAALPQADWPRVVMLSSSDLQEDRARALSIPIVAGYLTKPLAGASALALLAGQLPPDANN